MVSEIDICSAMSLLILGTNLVSSRGMVSTVMICYTNTACNKEELVLVFLMQSI